MGPSASFIESTITSFKTLVILNASVYKATDLRRASELSEYLSTTFRRTAEILPRNKGNP